MTKFTPNFEQLKGDASPSELARRLLIDCVKQYADRKGVTQDQIAEATGLRRQNVNRVLSGRYSPTLDTFLKIAGALGLHLDISAKD